MTNETNPSELDQAPLTPANTVPVPAAPNEYVQMTKQSFHFKKDTLKDEKGNVIKDDAGEPKPGSSHQQGTKNAGKHPSVEMYLPVPKLSRLVEFLQDPAKYPKEVELLAAAVFDQIYTVARGQINDFREKDINALVTPAALNLDKLDWTAIANTPKAERGAYAPSDEEVAAFCEAYLKIMPVATGKDEKTIKNHVVIFQGGFKKQRSQKDMLEFFVGMLTIFVSKAGEEVLEDNAQVVDYFVTKLKRWMQTEEKITMDML